MRNLEQITEKLSTHFEECGHIYLLSGGNFAFGAGLGALGKATGKEWIPGIPPIIDFLGSSYSPYYIFYGAGVAMNYLPEITTYLSTL